MRRISSDMSFTDMQFYLRKHEENLNNIQGKIGSQSRLQSLRDDPLAASHAVRYESYLNRLNRFEENTYKARDHLNNMHDYLNETNSIIQRIRELAVTGANGTYTKEETKMMGME